MIYDLFLALIISLNADQPRFVVLTAANVDKVPELCVQYGQQLEFRGKNDEALAMFESALSSDNEEGEHEGKNPDNAVKLVQRHDECEHEGRRAVCLAGIARCMLRSGDLRKGLRLARDAGSPQLFRECASILEGMKQPGEAAAMYELGDQEDRAAAIYVAAKDLDRAAAVIPRVTLPKLLGQYAKACEITGR